MLGRGNYGCFFGQFIPLHGVRTIFDAVRLIANEPIRWMVIGKGQNQGLVEQAAREALDKLIWISWIPYTELIDWIHRADICVRIFGDTERAARIIPNKIFQILACGLPSITRDSPTVKQVSDRWITILAVVFGVARFAFLMAALPPFIWDSRTYHLTNVAPWTQTGGIEVFETSVVGIYTPTNYELLAS